MAVRSPRFAATVAVAVLAAVVLSAGTSLWRATAVRTTGHCGLPLMSFDVRALSTSGQIIGQTADPAEVSLFVGNPSGGFRLAAVTSTAGYFTQPRPVAACDPRAPYPYAFAFDRRELGGFLRRPGELIVRAVAHDGRITAEDRWEGSYHPPNAGSGGGVPIARRDVNLTLSADRIRYGARVVFARDDPVLGLFLGRRLDDGALFDRLIDMNVAEVPLASIATRASLRIELAARTITVSFTGDSATSRPARQPGIGSTVSIVRFGIPGEPRLADTLRVRIADYRLESAAPLPDRSGRSGFYVWYGSSKSSEIELDVVPAFTDQMRLLRRWVAAHDWPADRGWEFALEVVTAAFAVLPLLIGIVLLRQNDPSVEPAERKLLAILLTASMMPSGAYLFYRTLVELRPHGYDPAHVTASLIGQLGPALRRPDVLAGLGTVLLLAAAVVVIARRFGNAPSAVPVRTLAAGYGAVLVSVIATVYINASMRVENIANAITAAGSTLIGLVIVISTLQPRLIERVVRREAPHAERWFAAAAAVAVIGLAVGPFVTKTLDQTAIPFLLSFDSSTLDTVFGLRYLATVLYVALFLVLHRSVDAMKNWNALPCYIAAMCAAFVVGTGWSISIVPAGFLLALLTFRWIALSSDEKRAAVDAIRAKLPAGDDERAREFAVLRDIKTLTGALEKVEGDRLTGGVKEEDAASTVAQLSSRRALLAEDIGLPATTEPADAAFGFGLAPEPRANGVIAARYGLAVGLVFLAFAVPELIDAMRHGSTLFSTLMRAAFPLAGRVAGAFLFGYFFASWRGTMGTTKALFFSLAAVIATLPVLLLTATRAEAISSTLSWVVFYGAIGAWFDVRNVRRLKISMQPRQLLELAGVGNSAAVSTFVLTTVGTIVTGQLKTLFPLILKSFFPGAPGQP